MPGLAFGIQTAHGHLEEYNAEQVENLYKGVVEFFARVSA